MVDPRTAAKVTSPDLVKAFQEGHGMTKAELEPSNTPPRVWLVLVIGDELTKASFDFDQLAVAMSVVENHLKKGDGHAAAVAVQVLPPEDWDDISDAVK